MTIFCTKMLSGTCPSIRKKDSAEIAIANAIDRARGDRLIATPWTSDLGFAGGGSNQWLFADGFLNRQQLGRQSFATLGLTNINVSDFPIDVTVDFYFPDGTTRQTTYTLNSYSPRLIELHRENILTSKPGLNFYAMKVSSNFAFLATMYHADLTEGGSWLTLGQALN